MQSRYNITVDRNPNLTDNYCETNIHACWNHPQSFRFEIEYFGIIEVYPDSQSSDNSSSPIQVSEGFFVHGKPDGLHRLTKAGEFTEVAWYSDQVRHGKSLRVDHGSRQVRREIYVNGTLNGTYGREDDGLKDLF